MFTNLSDLIKIPVALIAGMVLSAVALLFVYEGLSLPWIGQVIDGRVAKAEKAATAGMASKYELQSVQFQLQRERELRQASDDAAAAERKRAALSEAIAAQRQATIDQQAAEAAKDPDLSRPTAKDKSWLERH